MMCCLSTPQRRRHAQLLAARGTARAVAHAARMMAEAGLEDALADRPPAIADNCVIEREYPLIGRCKYRAGSLIEIERPWTEADAARAQAQDLDVAFVWASDPAAELREGELIYLYIGSRKTGPMYKWHCRDGWHRLVGNGNYGRNYAMGGTWSASMANTAEISGILARLQL